MITDSEINNRNVWVEFIQSASLSFADNSEVLSERLQEEIKNNGFLSLISHLRLCGDIPEWYGHDTSEEKLYSKYTDILLCEAYKLLGMKSIVLTERGDAADVEAFADTYSFVADAKAFRLSRTAKNQKDFKIEALNRWKYGKPYAMVVCPIYQLPAKQSQIYHSAITREVCIFTYSHLSILILFAQGTSTNLAQELLYKIFENIKAINPTKSSIEYWLNLNKTMLDFSPILKELWKEEKIVTENSVNIAKRAALNFLARERERICRMNHNEAISELLKLTKIQNRITTIQSVSNNNILDM